jgi:hypothetical protein
VSKERRRRRAEREREQAMQTAARAAKAERRERRANRKRAVGRRLGLDTLAGARYSTSRGRQSGALAQRRRQEVTITFCVLAAFNIVVWISRSDWGSRAGAVVVCLLIAPVVHILLHRRS